MKGKEVIVQIFTGGYEEEAVSFEKIQEQLLPLINSISVKKVIIGWARDKDIYEKTIQLLRPYGIECYLWLPVFSETGMLKPVKKLVDENGGDIEGYQLKAGENFEFYCPSQTVNIESFLSIYEENYSQIPFDGVFLDKIRFSSFANGISGVFNCFCPECQKQFESFDVSVSEIKQEMKKLICGDGVYQTIPFGAASYRNGRYTFENPIWEKFFKMKEIILMKALKKISAYFHEKKLKVGFDTFSPVTSYFVGQNMEHLAPIADFVKPMMYRITNAPAGLPFEINALVEQSAGNKMHRQAGTLAMNKNQEAKDNFYHLINCNKDTGEAFDKEFVSRELCYMGGIGTSVYAGIEINHIVGTAEATPEYIRENARLIEETDISGAVLSWDLLSAPKENVKEVIECFKHWR